MMCYELKVLSPNAIYRLQEFLKEGDIYRTRFQLNYSK